MHPQLPHFNPMKGEERLAEVPREIVAMEGVEELRAEAPPPDEEILGIFADVLGEPDQEEDRVEGELEEPLVSGRSSGRGGCF